MKIKLLSVGRHRQTNWKIAAHRHSFHEMIVVFSGCEGVKTCAAEFKAVAGEVLLFRPGEIHEEWTDGGEPLETVFLGFETHSSEGWPAKVYDSEGRVRVLASWLQTLQDESHDDGRRTQGVFFDALVAEYVRLGNHRESPVLESVREYVRRHISEPVRLDSLARQAGMSKFHFIRQYRRVAGRTPMEDVRRIRAERARDLILTTTLPIKVVAPMVGLSDEFALYRLFRRQFGIRPGQLRRPAGRYSRGLRA